MTGFTKWLLGEVTKIRELEGAEIQSGRTTRQMLAAPLDAWYVWPHDAPRDYPIALARSLNRGDLAIKRPRDLSMRGWHGLGVAIVIDHAVTLDDFEDSAYRSYLSMVDIDKSKR